MDKNELREMMKEIFREQTKSVLEENREASNSKWLDTFREAQDVMKSGNSSNRGIPAARFIRAITAARGDLEKASNYAKRYWDDPLGKMVAESLSKAALAGDPVAGGFMIPQDLAGDIVELLRPRSVVRAAGAVTLPMPFGNLSIPKQTGDVSANYVGENTDIPESNPTGTQINLSAKKLAALVPISNDLLTFGVGDKADALIRDSLVRSVAVREDRAFLRGDGLSNTPVGLRNQAVAGNVIASSGTNASNVETDVHNLLQALEGSDVILDSPAFFMAPRTKNFLMKLRDANGNLIYPELRDVNPRLLTVPVFVSNNIPTNLGVGTNESEVYLANMSDAIIGETGTLEITPSSEASYVEGGSLASAFSRDLTVIRAITRHDFAVRHAESVAVLTGVLWI